MIKESGFGREGLKYAIEEMTEMKLMARAQIYTCVPRGFL
jgi:acyl-CoA reductase-like NAD-dependent aldehyde dehydrogenase